MHGSKLSHILTPPRSPQDPAPSSPPEPTTSDTTNTGREDDAAAAFQLAEGFPSSSSASTVASSHNLRPTSPIGSTPRQNLTIDTDTPSVLSDADSSVVPTSARLSLATTQHSLPHSANGTSNGGAQGDTTIRQLLDSVLTNPGWNVAAAAAAGHASDAVVLERTGRVRGDSLFSIGRNSLQPSLVPTLPPYEVHRQHREVREVHVSFDDAGAGEGPSEHRGSQHQEGRSGGREKAWGGDEKHEGEDGNGDDACGPEGRSGEDNGDEGDANGDGHEPDDHATPPLHAVEQETANALSAHYSHIVRTIDERYTSELDRLKQELSAHQDRHVEELALMRNNVDAAYRQVLKARDQQVEKAKGEAATRASELENEVVAWKADNDRKLAETRDQVAKEKEVLLEEHAKNVERERNAVEDVWERRWRDRMSLVDEEASRRVNERDKVWLRFLDRHHPEILREAKEALLPVNGDIDGNFFSN